MAADFDLLKELPEKVKSTAFEPYLPQITIVILILIIISLLGPIAKIIKFTLLSIKKIIKRLFDHIFRSQAIKKEVYTSLNFTKSSDVYNAINKFVPTRFSSNNKPGYEHDPKPVDSITRSKDFLLIERFMKFELNIKNGEKYYLCLADCGMGKTTFLINLYYRILKQGKFKCSFISLHESSCLERIRMIPEKEDTILLLDALNENDHALVNYDNFMEKLGQETHEFYRVVITSRTNFFESVPEEYLFEHKRINGTDSKLVRFQKFYIEPFTDADIHRFLHIKYPFKYKKQTKSLSIINQNKDLAVCPLLLGFIVEELSIGQSFDYDFQLYDCLFDKWIEREKKSYRDWKGEKLFKEWSKMAESIYYQWVQSGSIGISFNELEKNPFLRSLDPVSLKGHSLLSRTEDGLYKFSYNSCWEYLLTKLAFTDMNFAIKFFTYDFKHAEHFMGEITQYYQTHKDEPTPEICSDDSPLYLLKSKKDEGGEELSNKAISNY